MLAGGQPPSRVANPATRPNTPTTTVSRASCQELRSAANEGTANLHGW